METETEDESSVSKIADFSRTETAEEEIERKCQDESGHDGPEADAGEIDGPVGSSQHESSQEPGSFAVEKFFP